MVCFRRTENWLVGVTLMAIACCEMLMVGSAVALGGETLYNGIELPDQWPPDVRTLTLDPMPVPYLDHPPAVIPIDVGRQFFVDDFLVESTTLSRTSDKPIWHPASPVLEPDASESAWSGLYRSATACGTTQRITCTRRGIIPMRGGRHATRNRRTGSTGKNPC